MSRYAFTLKWVLALIALVLFGACAPTTKLVPTTTTVPSSVASQTAAASPLPPLPTAPPRAVQLPTSALEEPSLPKGCDVPVGSSPPITVQTESIKARKVQALPLTKDGALPDPANDSPTDFAWWTGSGELGVSKQEVILTAHTYSKRQDALGNLLERTLQVGDIVRATGEDGHVYCYEVVEREVVKADAEYDVRGGGLMTIIFCSGHKAGVWTERTLIRLRLLE